MTNDISRAEFDQREALRNLFAAHALTGLLPAALAHVAATTGDVQLDEWGLNNLAERAFAVANAMMLECDEA